MAKLTYKFPIDEVHGKLKGEFGVAQRKAKNAKGERQGYSVCYGKRTTEVSEDETANRTRFGTIATMIKTRKANPTKRAQDQAAYKAQSTYTTYYSYLWHVCDTELTAQENANA